MRKPSISCVAVDDEPRALEVLERHISKIPFLQFRKSFRDPVEAIHWVEENEVDLIFLDINMPNISGIQFKKMLDPKILTAFTTAYSEFAVESYDLNALDYLVKPIRFERLLKTALKAKQHLSGQPHTPSTHNTPEPEEKSMQSVYIRSGNKLHKVNVDDILYLEKDGNYLWIHTKSLKLLSRFSMKEILSILPEEGFLKVHRSYAIGIIHIDSLENYRVNIGDRNIPVSKNYWNDLLSRLGI